MPGPQVCCAAHAPKTHIRPPFTAGTITHVMLGDHHPNLCTHFSHPPTEQHVKVSAMPMAKLQSVLEQACTKFKPALDPAACQLVLHEGRNKRVIDLQVSQQLDQLARDAARPALRTWERQSGVMSCTYQAHQHFLVLCAGAVPTGQHPHNCNRQAGGGQG